MDDSRGKLQPIPAWQSILWFGIPGLLMLIGISFINPYLVENGVPLIWSFTFLFYSPLLIVMIVSIIAYQRDGYAMNWHTFSQRMRFRHLTASDWAWTGGGLLIALLIEGIISDPASQLLSGISLFMPPAHLPALFNPAIPFDLPPTTFFGESLAGKGWVAVVYFIALIINIGGEELAWRGYLLPRQELTYGKKAWIINGLMWILILHSVIRWMYIGLLPTGLITPFIAQRTKNIIPAIIIHGTGNAIFLVLIIMGIFGIN